jgi:hypothetical protein
VSRARSFHGRAASSGSPLPDYSVCEASSGVCEHRSGLVVAHGDRRAAVAGKGHRISERDALAAGGGDESRAQTVAAKEAWIESGEPRAPLQNERDGTIGKCRAEPSVAVDRAYEWAGCENCRGEPGGECGAGATKNRELSGSSQPPVVMKRADGCRCAERLTLGTTASNAVSFASGGVF